MKRLWIGLAILVSTLAVADSPQAQWGEVKGEQVEDVYLRNDQADVLLAATATLTIEASNAEAGHVLLELKDGGDVVVAAGLPGYLVLDSTGGMKYGGESIRALGVVEDNAEHPRPLTYFGTCGDGSITYTSDGFRTPFASGCTPVVTLCPLGLDSGEQGDDRYLYYWCLLMSGPNGFTYEIRRATFDTVTFEWADLNENVTSSYAVHWQAMGWR